MVLREESEPNDGLAAGVVNALTRIQQTALVSIRGRENEQGQVAGDGQSPSSGSGQ
jgi:hypothetical protein